MQTQPADLVAARAVAGDDAAQQTLVSRHGPQVYALCRRLASDPEDCYQEIWEKVLSALPRFSPDGPPIGAWIHTIARRHLTDRHRRLQTRGQIVSIEALPPIDPGIDEHIATRQRQVRLEAALLRLPLPLRCVVVLHHIHGRALVDIAQEEGVAVGTIKSRLHRGRARLAALMRDEQ